MKDVRFLSQVNTQNTLLSLVKTFLLFQFKYLRWLSTYTLIIKAPRHKKHINFYWIWMLGISENLHLTASQAWFSPLKLTIILDAQWNSTFNAYSFACSLQRKIDKFEDIFQ